MSDSPYAPGVWHDHDGSDNPVPGMRVDVRLRNGLIMEDCGDVSWSHPAFADRLVPNAADSQGGDIIAFRIPAPTPAADYTCQAERVQKSAENEHEFTDTSLQKMQTSPEAGGLEVVGWRWTSGFNGASWFLSANRPESLPDARALTDHAPAEKLVAELRSEVAVAVSALERIKTVDMGGGFLGAQACRQVATEALDRLKQKGGGE